MASSQESHGASSRLLLCSQKRDSALATQSAVFRNAGYAVKTAANGEIWDRIENAGFNILVLNHTLSFADRKLLAGEAKRHNPESGVLVLHHSGSLGNPAVDLAIDSRTGAKAMLRALQRLEGMLHARSHLLEIAATYFVVADASRNYTYVTDSVCDLLGYDRANLLELRIDDVVAGATPVAAPLFQQFVNDREQTGIISLRHRSGRLVQVRYWAEIKPDGCMAARWEPVTPTAANG
jgi:PAS domain-containing protein